MRRARNQKGFTLVEIAIVLVIVGLLIGAILKGQEMIKSAKQKKVMTTAGAITAAVNTYLDKTGKLPGEDPANPGQMLTAAAVFTDLYNQGVVPGVAVPKDPYGGDITIDYYAADTFGTHNAGNFIGFPGTGADAEASLLLDQKFDDATAADTVANDTGAIILSGTTLYMPVQ
jgi:prepilin-type N-terminal cleavage/methylation domain-containing protein